MKKIITHSKKLWISCSRHLRIATIIIMSSRVCGETTKTLRKMLYTQRNIMMGNQLSISRSRPACTNFFVRRDGSLS
jgi:hypothetical protein